MLHELLEFFANDPKGDHLSVLIFGGILSIALTIALFHGIAKAIRAFRGEE